MDMPLYQKCQWDVLHLYQIPCPLWLQQSPSTESIPVKQLKVKNLYVHVFIDNAELHRLVIQCKTIQVTEVDESWCPVTQIRDDTFAFDECINREKGGKDRKQRQERKRIVKDLRGSPWSETPWLGFLHKSWALYSPLSVGASYSFVPFCLWMLELAEWVGIAL